MAVWPLIYGNGTWEVALSEQNLLQVVEKKFLRSDVEYWSQDNANELEIFILNGYKM
jgi:hypothetical protein